MLFCFGVGVKDSPNFKISISSWASGTIDEFKIFLDCGCVIGNSWDSRFFGNYGEFEFEVVVFSASYQFYLNPVLLNMFFF